MGSAPASGWQGSLLAGGAPSVDAAFAGARRRDLGDGAWIDHVPSWLAGADTLFAELLEAAPWQSHEIPMYGQQLVQPRLSAHWGPVSGPGLPPIVPKVAAQLSHQYGVRFDSVGANLYRNGRDSVAWHGDRVLRTVPVATVAIVSLGATRRFLLRRKGGGPSVPFEPAAGDLLVMGGTSQRTWQHTVPKTSTAVGPRVSVTFRHRVAAGHDMS